MSPPTGNGGATGAGSQILARLDTLEKKLDRLLAHLGADRPAGNNGAASGGRVASMQEIQGDKGDPKIGKMPKNWKGANFENMHASQCSPEFLDFWSDFLDYKADNPREGKEKYVKFDRLDAARCRRWAVEIREGRVSQAPAGGGASWDDGPPPARPTPRSAAPEDPWGGGGDWGSSGGDAF